MRDEIEEKIYQEAKNYVIKTSSSDILKKYEEGKTKEIVKKTPWWLSRGFRNGAIAFSSCLVIASISMGIYFGVSRSGEIDSSNSIEPPIISPIAPSNNEILNKASYELIAGVSLYEEHDSSSQTISNLVQNVKGVIRPKRLAPSENELKTAISLFDEYSHMVISLKETVDLNSYYTPINSDNTNYKYAIKIEDDFILYYNESFEETDEDETTSIVNAFLKSSLSQETYQVVIKKEVERSQEELEIEISTTIYSSSSNYIEISQSSDVEDNEKENSYELKQYVDNKETLSLSFDIEEENNEEETTFNIEKVPNVSSSYEYTLKNFNMSDQTSFTIIYEGLTVLYTNGIYTYNGKQIHP